MGGEHDDGLPGRPTHLLYLVKGGRQVLETGGVGGGSTNQVCEKVIVLVVGEDEILLDQTHQYCWVVWCVVHGCCHLQKMKNPHPWAGVC